MAARLRDLKQSQGALRHHRKTVDLCVELVEQFPEIAIYQRYLNHLYRQLIRAVETHQGKDETWRQVVTAAAQQMSTYLQATASESSATELARRYHRLGELYYDLENFADARPAFESAVRYWQELDPDLPVIFALSRAKHALGNSLRQLDELDLSQRELEEAILLQRTLGVPRTSSPGSPGTFWRQELRRKYLSLANTLELMGSRQEANNMQTEANKLMVPAPRIETPPEPAM